MDAADTGNVIDPLSWISAERQVVSAFAASTAQAADDLSGTIADFAKEINAELASEAQFTNDLASLINVVNPAAIAQAVQDLSSSDSAIDTAFSQLHTTILQNNQAAGALTQQIAAASDGVQQIDRKRTALQGKIANYKSVLSTFRVFSGGATTVPSSAASPAP
jgi:chromosome segregation ATPase